MKKEFPVRTTLRHGQALCFLAPKGLSVVSVRGTVRIRTSPGWTGDQMIQEQFVVAEGQAHAMHQGGWIMVDARGDAEIVCVAPEKTRPSWLTGLFAAFAAVLRRQKNA